MLPTRGFEPADTRRYNRLMTQEFESVRDFLIFHYHATERADTPYWNHVRTMAIPESLEERIRIYRATGRVFREANELFTKTSWLAIMDGQGLGADSYDPLAGAIPFEDAKARLSHIAAVTAAAVARMPAHEEFIRTHCAATA